MNHFILSLVFAGLLIGDPFSLSGLSNNLWAESTNRFSVQVASHETLKTAQKEMARLQAFGLEAKYTTRVDRFNKKWFIIYFNDFETKEKATRYGNELVNEGVIKNFQIFSKKEKDEFPAKTKESPTSAPISSLKESKPVPEKSPHKEKDEFPAKVKESSPPPASIPFSLQVASCETLITAQKEIDRLKTFNLEAKHATLVDTFNKQWFIVYINNFKTKEEATQYGKQLVDKNIIQNFRVFNKKVKKEVPAKAKDSPVSASIPSIKESQPLLKISPVYFGPIVIKEEETSLRINIFMDQKIFPEIMSDKISDGSRLILTFKNIDKYVVPVEFDKVQSKTLLSFSVANKGPDCIFILLLSASYNYEVSQNYYEREKIYSLFIGREAVAEPNRIIKE